MFKSTVKLSDLQLAVMKVLWQQGKLSVSQVHQEMNKQRELALTTVATLLKRMHEKEIVAIEKQGRMHVYSPLVSEQAVKTSMLSNMLEHLFDGKPEDLVHHLVGQDDIKQTDLDKIQKLLSQGNDHE
jgi:predicted transcriptional regulator